jgi:hypothetical protein
MQCTAKYNVLLLIKFAAANSSLAKIESTHQRIPQKSINFTPASLPL